jgi:hypothetical protein
VADTFDACAYWPIQWNFSVEGEEPCDGRWGAAVTDPDVFRVVATIIDEDDLALDVRLSDSIDAMIDGESSDDGVVGDSHRPNMIAIRDHLRALANRIDEALAIKPRDA